MNKTDTKKLIECIRSRDLPKLNRLLRADPNAAKSAQAIGEAARVGSIEVLELLHASGADLNAGWRNYRPLHSLIQEEPHGPAKVAGEDRIAVLKWMLAHGADPEQLGGWPATRAIITAAFVGEPSYVAALREGGAVIDGFVAAALGDLRRVEKALAREDKFAQARDPAGLTALHCCAGSRMGKSSRKTQSSLLAIAGLLLDRGADLSASVRSWAHDVDAVYFAVSSGQCELFALLIQRGADATSALPPVVWKCEWELAKLAMGFGGELDRAIDEGKPLLNQMIRWGQFKQALWMLEHGASPNVADTQGWTAVHQAASRGNEKMLKAVLKAGGHPDRKDNDGDTPLIVALARGRPKIIALLDE